MNAQEIEINSKVSAISDCSINQSISFSAGPCCQRINIYGIIKLGDEMLDIENEDSASSTHAITAPSLLRASARMFRTIKYYVTCRQLAGIVLTILRR